VTASVSAPLLAVRRSVAAAALSAWCTASLQGGASADDVADAAAAAGLQRVRSSDGCDALLWVLAGCRADGFRVGRLVLPAPGDPLGVPGPALLQRQALAAGAAIVLLPEDPVPDRAAMLVPGGEGEWLLEVVEVPPTVPAQWPTLRQARADFSAGVAGHAAALTDLDVAADALGLRRLVLDEDEQPLPALPPDWSSERRELLGRARLVAVLAATAVTDDGSAVSAAEASARAAHLRALAAIARRAIAAAGSGA
jgi:hypothetical protein